MKTENSKLGCIIKRARIAKQMTQNQLAEIMGITPRHLMSIENGNRNPSYDLLYRLIRELDICADTIFYPERKPTASAADILSELEQLTEDDLQKIMFALLSALDENQKVFLP